MKLIRTSEVPTEERGGYRIRRLATEALPRPENVGLYQTMVPKGSKVSAHAHAGLKELLYFINPARVVVDGKDHLVGAGDFMILEPGEVHEIFADDEELTLLAFKLPNLVHDRVTPG